MLAKRVSYCIVTSALLIVGLTVPAHADIIAANNLTSPPSYSSFDLGIGFAGNTVSGPFTNETPAQEFTAGASGTITTLTASVGQFQPGGVSLDVSILGVSGGLPGALLGTVSFTPSQVSASAFTSPTVFDLSSAGISLTAGQDYFARFSVATPISSSIRYQALLLNTSTSSFGFAAIDSPDGGATWLAPVIPNEIGLTVRVGQTAVPEPLNLFLVGLGLITVAGLRVRRMAT